MRMSKSGISAEDIVNDFSETELADIFWRFGEEKFSRKIASKIVNERKKERITTTTQLAEIIANAYPASARRDGHPARKVFQALRIAVNGELDELETALKKAFKLLKPDGVLAITLELAARFLADYLNGDVYFKCKMPRHNLVRTKAQIALAKDIYGKMPKLRSLLEGIIAEINV